MILDGSHDIKFLLVESLHRKYSFKKQLKNNFSTVRLIYMIIGRNYMIFREIISPLLVLGIENICLYSSFICIAEYNASFLPFETGRETPLRSSTVNPSTALTAFIEMI